MHRLYMICCIFILYKNQKLHVFAQSGFNVLQNALWFNYIHYGLQVDLKHQQLCLTEYLSDVVHNINKRAIWCFPKVNRNHSSTTSTIHLVTNVPCGYLQLHNSMINIYQTILVHELFGIQLIFSLFEMDDGGAQCETSFFKVLVNEETFAQNWVATTTACGHRQPWNISLESNELVVQLKQRNVFQYCNITMNYVMLEKKMALRIIRDNHVVTVTDAYHQKAGTILSIIYDTFSSTIAIQQWDICVHMGFKVVFKSIKLDALAGNVQLYDGPDTHIIIYDHLRNKSVTNTIQSVYFQARMVYSMPELTSSENSSLFLKLRYKSLSNLRAIQVNTNKTLRTNGKNLNHLYHIVSMSSGLYPNVSLVIRKFHGWNEGGCTYGGYLISQISLVKTIKSYHLGPFCSKTSKYFINPHDLEHIATGKSRTYITVYAYSPWYWVDMDIVVGTSRCEGILEPLQLFDSTRYSAKHNHMGLLWMDKVQMSLMKIRINNDSLEARQITLTRFKGCIVLQSMSYVHRISVTFLIMNPVRIALLFRIPRPILTERRHYRERKTELHLTHVDQSQNSIKVKSSFQSDTVYTAVRWLLQTWAKTEHLSFTMNAFPVTNVVVPCVDTWERNETLVTMSHICGTFNCVSKNMFWIAFLTQPLLTKLEKRIMYVTFSKVNCSRYQNLSDVVMMRSDTSKIVQIIQLGRSNMQLRAHHCQVQFTYSKQQTCAFVEISYRIQSIPMLTLIGQFDNKTDYIEVTYR